VTRLSPPIILGFRLLLALEAPQSAQLIPEDRVSARRAALDPADVQCARCELNLIPPEVYKLGGTKPVTVGEERE
jgi:hypothetical protein